MAKPRLVKTKDYWFIVENRTIKDQFGKSKNKRTILERLGKISKRQAQDALIEFQGKLTTGYNPSNKRLTLKNLMDSFQKHYETQINSTITQRTYDSYVQKRNKFNPIDHLYVNEVTYLVIEDFKKTLKSKKASNRYINILLSDLSKTLKYGVRANIISHMPIIDRMPESVDRKPIEKLTDEQIKIALEKIEELKHPEKLRFYVSFMLLTGLRPAEFHKLEWTDIELDKGIITIRSSNPRKRPGAIPITDPLRKLLESIIDKTGFVCPYGKGVSKMFQRLTEKTKFKVNPYMLRKTFASKMRDKGILQDDLADIMRNSPEMLQRHYVNRDMETVKQSIESSLNSFTEVLQL